MSVLSLRKYDVNEVVFNEILEKFPDHIKMVPSIDPYRSGYKGTDIKDKSIIVYDGTEYLVILEYQLQWIVGEGYDDNITLWKQVIVRKTPAQTEKCEVGVTGTYAWNYMYKLLSKYYTEEEFDERLKLFQAEYDHDKIQVHYEIGIKYELLTFDNCYKYDINGAHHDALIEIFPRAEEALRNMFEKRKEIPKYKAFINYFVGYLCKKGYRTTYNWIVQRTTKTLTDAINACNGTIIYANTDGFIIRDNENKLNASKELGKFKEEYNGQVRFYRDKNWYAYEIDTDNESKRIVGNVSLSVRDKIHLNKGEIVHYDRVKKKINDVDYIYVCDNIQGDKI